MAPRPFHSQCLLLCLCSVFARLVLFCTPRLLRFDAPPFQRPSIPLVMALRPLCFEARRLALGLHRDHARAGRYGEQLTVYPHPDALSTCPVQAPVLYKHLSTPLCQKREREHASSREATQCGVPKGPPSSPTPHPQSLNRVLVVYQ